MQDDFIDRMLELYQGAMQAIGNGQLLEVQPKALNGIEKGTIFKQPDHHQAVFDKTQGGLSGFAVVVGGVIHDQNELLTGVLCQQMLKKGNKRIAVFVSGGEVTEAICVPVVGAKHMQKLWTARRRDELTLTTPHPTAAQQRM